MKNSYNAFTNKDFSKYDQVEKNHTYSLAQNSLDEFDKDYKIKTLNLDKFLSGNDKDKLNFSSELSEALQEIGFAIFESKYLNKNLYNDIFNETIELFTKTSLEKKLQFRAKRFGSISQGYFPIKQTSDIHPDLVEGWVWCRRAFNIPQKHTKSESFSSFWPKIKFEKEFRKMVIEHEKLFKPILQSMFLGLGCNKHLYDKKMEKTNFGLRLNYFPSLPSGQDPAKGGRLLGHEDVDLFTILPAPKTEGLQVWNYHNNKWIKLKAPENSLIINVGDYLQRITNDYYRSTSHRVAKPTNNSITNNYRVSFPMAVYLWENEILEVLPGLGLPKYKPIKAITFHTKSTSKFYGDDYAVEENN